MYDGQSKPSQLSSADTDFFFLFPLPAYLPTSATTSSLHIAEGHMLIPTHVSAFILIYSVRSRPFSLFFFRSPCSKTSPADMPHSHGAQLAATSNHVLAVSELISFSAQGVL